jgi:hypothetical protein
MLPQLEFSNFSGYDNGSRSSFKLHLSELILSVLIWGPGNKNAKSELQDSDIFGLQIIV